MSEYISIRRGGSFLFRYNPAKNIIHLKKGKKEWFIDLEEEAARVAEEPLPRTATEALGVSREVAEW